MQDAFNLAWKLAFVVKGYAGKELLDSYSLERAPVGAQVVKRANESRADYAPLNQCFRESGAADPVASGLAKLADPGPEGVARRAALTDALAVKNYEFNAQGVELNQRCKSGAVIPDPEAAEEVFVRDYQLYLQATTRPGAKIPHAWVIGVDGRRVSTLDLVGKGMFTLVSGIAGTAWVEAAQELALPYLRTIVIGKSGALDVYCNWARLREIEEAGALLVRPDGVVAWRRARGVPNAAAAGLSLRKALAAILAMEPG
jgi:2,4-dichlorophenol 6-monooxygenase